MKANSSTGNRKGINCIFLIGLKELHICANFGVRLYKWNNYRCISPEKPWPGEAYGSSIPYCAPLFIWLQQCPVSLTRWLPDLQSIFVPALHRLNPLSQWKTHLGLITWARLLPFLLSFTEEALSFFHPLSFSFTLTLSFSLCSLVSSLLVLQLPDQGSPALLASQNTHTHRTSNTLMWPRGHRYSGTKAFRWCIVISRGSAIG